MASSFRNVIIWTLYFKYNDSQIASFYNTTQKFMEL